MKSEDLRKELETLRHQLSILEQKAGLYEGPVIKYPPVRPYRNIVKSSADPGYTNRILVGTATTGVVRMEWVSGRYGQIIPCNWSYVQTNQWIGGYIPLGYQVAEAQNLIVREAIRRDMEWLLLLEHDTIPPADAFLRLNRYMIEKQVPVVSGLYYTRSRPSEPILYRGRGTGYYADWNFGDLVWVDGVPTGCLLIHGAILREMWEDAEEYEIKHASGMIDVTRRVFQTARKGWFDPETGEFNTKGGTSDLDWCTRVMEGGYFKKAGWDEYQDLEYPFLVDTNIFCKHIDIDGTIYP